MASKSSIRRYRNCYAKLLRLYPKWYQQRFGEGMEQTFNDLCRERAAAERGLFRFALWILFETSAGIIRENINYTFMNNRKITRIAVVVGILLLVPLLGNRFVDGWNW